MEAKCNPTFGMLPTRESCIKLMAISFSSPQKNLTVYRFCNKVVGFLEFVETERSKIVKKYGDPTEKEGEYFIPKPRQEEYNREIKELYGTRTDEPLELGLTEEDFEMCHYPNDERMWLSAGEIMIFLGF